MTRTLLSAITIFSLALPSTASANDIVDFLRAIQGPGPQRYDVHDDHRGHAGHGHREVIPTRISRSVDRRSVRVPVQRVRRTVVSQRPGLNFQISFGNSAPAPQPVLLLPPPLPILEAPPVPGSFGHLPHQIGEIVACDVTLEPHVVIKDACQVAPHAVPVIVAVRDPHLSRFGSRGCVERMVYVEVLVPNCPAKRIRVSPCKTKIRMDFGQYEVDITSRNGFVEIDYDN